MCCIAHVTVVILFCCGKVSRKKDKKDFAETESERERDERKRDRERDNEQKTEPGRMARTRPRTWPQQVGDFNRGGRQSQRER